MKLFPQHPYIDFLIKVSKPARYIGLPTCDKTKKSQQPDLTLLLAFPDIYEVGCSNIGMLILYNIAKRYEWVDVDTVYAPWIDFESTLRQKGLKLKSYESAKDFGEFDLIGFSLQHELTFTNVLSMLELGGINLKSSNRGEKDPIIIAGGPAISNPEPMAPFIDCFCFGDGEALLPEILNRVKDCKRYKASRKETLIELAKLKSIYVPALYKRKKAGQDSRFYFIHPETEQIPRRIKYKICRWFESTPVFIPEQFAIEPVFDKFQIEITRGCRGGCRFCHAGSIYRPVRHRKPEDIISSVIEGIEKGGFDGISLSSLSPSEYPYLEPTIKSMGKLLQKFKVELSVSSLRTKGLSRDILKEIGSIRRGNITLAPEVGTEKLRNIINKHVTEEELYETIDRMIESGWQKIKLYFMIGLPGEDERDILMICQLIKNCYGKFRGRVKRIKMSVSISNFVPKPHTPLQWERFNTIEELKKKARIIRKELKQTNVKLDIHDPFQSLIESIISRGGIEISHVILNAYLKGCRMDGWKEMFNFRLWQQALKEEKVEVTTATGTIPYEAPLPWSHVTAPVTEKFLRTESQTATQQKPTPACYSPDGKTLCHHCGAGCSENHNLSPVSEVEKKLREIVNSALTKIHDRRSQLWHHPAHTERIYIALGYIKAGNLIYTGHNDTMRIIRRILRKSLIPLRFSSGFNPRPIIHPRVVLPLGVIGLNEEVFFEVEQSPTDPQSVLDLLNENTRQSIRFTSIRTASRNEVRKLINTPLPIKWFAISKTSIDEKYHQKLKQKMIEFIKEEKAESKICNIKIMDGDLEKNISMELVDRDDYLNISLIALPDRGKHVKFNFVKSIFEKTGLNISFFARRILTD